LLLSWLLVYCAKVARNVLKGQRAASPTYYVTNLGYSEDCL